MFLSGITDLFFGPGRRSVLLPVDNQDVTRWMPRRGCESPPHRDACCTAPFSWVLSCPLPRSAFLVLWLVICGSSVCDWVSCNLS